jgi:hypothetical protein
MRYAEKFADCWGKAHDLIEKRTFTTFSGRTRSRLRTLVFQVGLLSTFSHERRPQCVLGAE